MNIRNIAEKAGVSVATVSRVLNHPETVKEATRKKIEAIMESEEYTPNWFARGLNFNKTGTIGLMLPNILDNTSIEVAKGVEDVAHQKEYTTLICNVENDLEKERKYLQLLVQRKVDGIVMIQPSFDEKDFEMLKENNIPSVIIGENKHVNGTHTVTIDSCKGAKRAMEHLLNIGYTKVAIVCGDTPRTENANKLKGYSEILQKHGIKYVDKYVVNAPNTIEGGYIAAKKLIEMDDMPEAIFATSDTLAFGIMDAVYDNGMTIPDDIGVVGFDNIRMSNLVTPKLTTVEKPLHKMGVMGARLLIDFIDGDEEAFSGGGKEIVLMSKLKIRKSCGHKERIGEMF